MRSLPPPTHTAAVRPRSPLIGEQCERCLYCRGTHLTREVRRYKKLETVQLWRCHECDRSFTPQIAKGKTFPLAVILDALMRYYRGETRRHVTAHIKERFGLSVSPRTLSQWLAEYRPLTTYARLRPQLLPHCRPPQLIRSTRLHHQQVYYYCIHRGKLTTLLSTAEHCALEPLETYLTEMATSYPHPLFQHEHRASASVSAFDLTGVEITEKQNLAPRIAGLVLQTVPHNKRRHETLQRLMLETDSVTVAIECRSTSHPRILRICSENWDAPFLSRLRQRGPTTSTSSQWSCGALATVLAHQTGGQRSRESVRCVLKKNALS
jgi:hypothetical protein